MWPVIGQAAVMQLHRLLTAGLFGPPDHWDTTKKGLLLLAVTGNQAFLLLPTHSWTVAKCCLRVNKGGGSCVKLWPLKAGKKPDLPFLLKTCVYSLTNPPVNAGMDHSFGPGKNYHMTIRESSLSTQRVTALTEVTQKNRRRSSPPANALSHSRQQVLSVMAVTWGQRRQCSCHHEM